MFTSNEDKIYAYVKYEASKRERPYESMLASSDSTSSVSTRTESDVKYHKVRRGESLSEISNRYGITMSELKKWNRLKNNKAPLGKSLKIITSERVAVIKKVEKKDTTLTNPNKIYKEEQVISFKNVVKMHKVKSGDNLGAIADKYNVSIAEVKKWNKLKSTNIPVGKSLKIIKNERVVTTIRKEIKTDKIGIDTKTENSVATVSKEDMVQNGSDYYEVQKGDNLFTIAKKYNVSLEDLKKWNNLDDGDIKLGSKLALANNEENQKEKVADTQIKTVEYAVEKGDNLLTIAKKHNVSVSDLKDWNNIDDNNIQYGTKLIVGKKLVSATDDKVKTSKKESLASVSKAESAKHYYVKKGDSLFSIAKQYPGVSISDIKKWNGIKNESLKPGMKLKING
jgi:membrane-bound lytic murein transglycosylase D